MSHGHIVPSSSSLLWLEALHNDLHVVVGQCFVIYRIPLYNYGYAGSLGSLMLKKVNVEQENLFQFDHITVQVYLYCGPLLEDFNSE